MDAMVRLGAVQPPSERMGMTVLGGFLGAGKTTLLNRLLREHHGQRIAVVVNDFGSINIDAELVTRRDGDTISLANGCICCSIGGSLLNTLVSIARRPVLPEHLFIEASGVADPWRVAEIGLADRRFRLEGVIVLADCERVRQQAEDRYIGDIVCRQLDAADLVVLNKIDLMAPPHREEVARWLRTRSTNIRIIEAVHAGVALDLLTDVEPRRFQASGYETHQGHGGDPPPDRFGSWSFSASRPFASEAFREVIDALPASVLRAKGVLLMADELNRRTIFQMVGRRWRLEDGGAWDLATPSSKLVLIGMPCELDASLLQERFTGALA